MRRKITFYMCNNFNSFQIICSLFSHSNIWTVTLQRKVFSHSFHIRKCWIYVHFNIWIFLNVPSPVSFKQMCRHNEPERQLALTEPQMLPRDLNTSYLHALFGSLNYQSFPNSGQIFIVTQLIIRHRTLLCDRMYLST